LFISNRKFGIFVNNFKKIDVFQSSFVPFCAMAVPEPLLADISESPYILSWKTWPNIQDDGTSTH
jgi:hypothetical protein